MLLSLKALQITQAPVQSYDITDYISDSMYVWADGIYNQGINKAHSNSATYWENLAGGTDGSYSGTASRRKWGDNCAVFSGQNDGYEFSVLGPGTWTPTLEAVFSMSAYTSGTQQIFNNQETGGVSIYCTASNQLAGSVYIGSQYVYSGGAAAKQDLELQKLYHAAVSCDGKDLKLYANGKLIHTVAVSGLPKITANTPLTVGRDARRTSGSSTNQHFLNGKVYAARAYSRVLSDEEILHNYKVDSYRFGIV